MKTQKKKKTSNIVLIVVFIVGLCLMLYPIVSDMWNKNYTTHLISEYDTLIKQSDDEYDEILKQAVEYNNSLVGKTFARHLTQEEIDKYNSFLNITDGGMMGYVEIPSIDVKLPIYHGVDEAVLQVATGHLNWSSLPVGGTTSHCVISGHRGLPSAKLLSDLNELVEGDYFEIKVLNKSMWYEVDKISIVEPDKVDDLTLVNGKDYVTLVTCTPYGINTHRLLVRGHRVTDAQLEKVLQVTADGTVVSPIFISIIIFVPFSLIALSLPFIINRKKKKI